MERHAYTSLARCLPERAANEPDRSVYIFWEGEEKEQRITYARLYEDACAYAQTLRSLNSKPGDLIVLVFDHGYEVLAAFWGAIHFGAVPIIFPYFTPDALLEVYQKSLPTLTDFADAQVIVTLPELEPAVRQWAAGTRCVSVSQSSKKTPDIARNDYPLRGGEEIAYLQLTTGSSGPSKGAMISHRAALNRMTNFSAAFGVGAGETTVSWVSLNQAAAINYSVIPPVVVGCTAVHIPPRRWARHPHLLLQAIQRFRGVSTTIPNSGLHHCARNTREQDILGVDLRHWRVLGIAGEIVRHESLQLFTERFAPYGLTATALRPFYACTECSFISASANDFPHVDWTSRTALDSRQQAVPAPSQSSETKPVVSCGVPLPGVEVKIVDDEGHPCPERHVGEIAVRSAALFSGYYRRADLTAQALRDGWFYTGDLGYVADGQLYLCDRKKDVIVTGGRNIYAIDIETLAEKIVGTASCRAVAFGVPDATLGTELPVLVVEVQTDLNSFHRAQLVRQIRRQVSQAHNVALADVRVVDIGWVVKTPKVSRPANRQKYLACGFRPSVVQLQQFLRDNQLPTETSAAPSDIELEHYLTELFEGALGVHPVGREENFFDLGGDSLVFVNLLVALENRLGRSLPIDALAERPTIADMLHALGHPTPTLTPPITVYHDHLHPLSVMKQVLRESNLSIHEKGRRLLHLIYVRLMYTGPRFLEYTLPYAIGTKMLEWVCRHEGMTKLIFRKRADMVHRGLMALHPTNKMEAFRQSLRTHVWMHWRLAALARCSRAEFDRWVTVTGLDTFQGALQQGRGVVLVMSHFAPLFFSPLALGRLHFDNFLVVGAQRPFAALLDLMGLSHLKERHHFAVTDHDRRRASQLLTAQQWLSEGNIVLISGDGDQGQLPFLLPFCGRQRRFGVGFAELAVRTGASVMPIFHTMTPGGRIKMEFLAPLETNGETRQDTVGALVRQYATLLERRWLRDPGSVHIQQLNSFLHLSLAAS